MDFGYYFKVFLRRLPYFLILFFLGTAAGITLAMMLPPVYRAEATLVVQSEQIPDELAASTVQTGALEQLQIIQQRIQTREVLLEVANRLGVYRDTGRARLTADEMVTDMRSRMSLRFMGGGGGRRSTGPDALLVNIAFEAPNGAMAANVANELVTLILRENVEMRTAVSGQTLDFFTGEVERLGRELSRRSAEMLAFQEQNLDSLPDSLSFRRSQQAAQQERLVQLQRGEAVLQDRRQRLVTLYETTGSIGAAPEAEANLSPEARQLRQMQNEYSNALALLAPTNPKVVAMKSRIDALEQVVAQQQASASGVATTDGQGPSAYEVQLADIDGQLEFIAQQKSEIAASLEQLKASIEETPGNAVTLEALQRDYDAAKTRYNQAVQNKGRAETGDTIESLSKGQRISVLEQASAPREPDSPNRPLIAAAGVGGGLAAGLALVLLLELLNASVRRPVDLTSKLGISPFGTVPYIWTAPQLVRRRTIIAGAFVFVLAAVPAGLWIIDTQVTPIQPLIGRVLNRLDLSQAMPSPLPGSAPLTAIS